MKFKCKTLALDGSEVMVKVAGNFTAIRNDSSSTVYLSAEPGIVPEKDGVAAIPIGGSMTINDDAKSVYVLGSGKIFLFGTDSEVNPFKESAQTGGSGADEVARAAINSHAGNTAVHVTAAEKAAWNAKAELSDIPKTLPANGGNADTVGGKSLTELVNCETARQLTASINSTDLIGTYSCESSYTPDYPTEAGIGYYGLLDVRKYGSIVFQTMMFENGVIIHRAIVSGAYDWTPWQRLNDNGNAATLENHPASDFVLKSEYDALEARVAALETT